MVTLLYMILSSGVIVFWLVVVFAAVGRSIGVTKLYIRILLFVFEVHRRLSTLYYQSPHIFKDTLNANPGRL